MTKNENQHWVGAWVRAARKHADLSQEELGDRMSLTKGNISAWENNRHSPSIQQLAKVAEISGYPLPDAIGKFASLDAEPGLAEKAGAVGLTTQAMLVARAFDQLASAEQRVAVIAQLKAFGVL